MHGQQNIKKKKKNRLIQSQSVSSAPLDRKLHATLNNFLAFYPLTNMWYSVTIFWSYFYVYGFILE